MSSQSPTLDLRLPPTRVLETHVSTLFFIGDRVYKLKKAIRTGFLDWTTPERRRTACVTEVALNRRIAPDVYLGVADIIGQDGKLCDSLVVMRRLPADRALSFLVRSGANLSEPLRALARLLADFHSSCRHDREVAMAGTAEAIEHLWAQNCSEMGSYVDSGLVDPEVMEEIERASETYISGRRRLFESRIQGGRIRDGHGDLLAEDIFVLDDGVRVLDCLEFDPALRYGDVLSDVAFLAMDLEALGAADESAKFLTWYREFSADTWPPSLADHWIAYRALVRAKVSLLRYQQGQEGMDEEAEHLLWICRKHLRHGSVRLVLVGGLPATGKTTTALGLADQLGCVVMSSDDLRHQLGSQNMTSNVYREGLYSPSMTETVYRSLLDQAESCMKMGETVVLDASWTDSNWRHEAAECAARCHANLVEIECVAPDSVTERRLLERPAAHHHGSDATVSIAKMMASDASPWPSASHIDTSGGARRAIFAALKVAEHGVA